MIPIIYFLRYDGLSFGTHEQKFQKVSRGSGIKFYHKLLVLKVTSTKSRSVPRYVTCHLLAFR